MVKNPVVGHKYRLDGYDTYQHINGQIVICLEVRKSRIIYAKYKEIDGRTPLGGFSFEHLFFVDKVERPKILEIVVRNGCKL